MSVTIQTFPPLHSFNSRSWALLLIVTLHLGFFWALTAGLATRITDPWKPPTELVPIDQLTPRTPPKPVPPTSPTIDHTLSPQPPKPEPLPPIFENEFVPPTGNGLQVPNVDTSFDAPRGPVVVMPSIDPAIGLSEPPYPPQEIRQQHTGTVLLSVQVLANGRVGEVRIDQSSGYPRLDASAAREARLWRFQPGTSDGVPVVMWRQVPITFQLK